jgi:hypothetical protein
MTMPEAVHDVVVGSGIGALTALAILGLPELTTRWHRHHNRVRRPRENPVNDVHRGLTG